MCSLKMIFFKIMLMYQCLTKGRAVQCNVHLYLLTITSVMFDSVFNIHIYIQRNVYCHDTLMSLYEMHMFL